MKTLKILNFGDEVQGVRLRGDRRNPEPAHFRVSFPGGDVEIVRATDSDKPEYWIHVRVNGPEDLRANPEYSVGQIVDARLDIRNKHASDSDIGDFADPNLYHLAVRIVTEG